MKDCNCQQAIKKFERSQVPLLQIYLLSTPFHLQSVRISRFGNPNKWDRVVKLSILPLDISAYVDTVLTQIDWHLTLPSRSTPLSLSPSLTLAAAVPAAVGSEEDQSPVLMASHGVVDRGSNGLEAHGVEERVGRPTRVGS